MKKDGERKIGMFLSVIASLADDRISCRDRGAADEESFYDRIPPTDTIKNQKK